MTEMVERLARVLEPQAWAALGTGDTLAYQNRRTSSLLKARAVLEALREPTPDMVEAGRTAWLESASDYNRVDASNLAAFQAMIDTALGK